MSCEASNCGSGVLCAKSTFFPLLLNRTREARALCGFQHRDNLICFLLSGRIIVGLRPTIMAKTRNKAGFPRCVETHTRRWLLLLCSTADPDSEKKRVFRTLDRRQESSPHMARIVTKLGGCILH